MSALDGRGVPDLGGQKIEVRKFTVYPLVSIDAEEGSPIPGPFDAHLRVVLVTAGEVLLFPCSRAFLRTLSRQCLNVGTPPTQRQQLEGSS